MAILTTEELADIRQNVAAKFNEINWDKPIINAALQAIEDWFEANKAAGSAAIDTATSPFIFTSPQKKLLFAYWLFHKFMKEVI